MTETILPATETTGKFECKGWHSHLLCCKMKIIPKDLQFSPGKAVERDADLKDRRIMRATSGAHDI